ASRHAAAGRGAAPGADVTEIPEAFAISEGPDMWRTIGDRTAGQSTSEWRSRGFTRQPSEFSMPGEPRGNALDIAAANALTAYESGIATYRGRVIGVESKQANSHDNTWAGDAPLRVRVQRPDGSIRLIYTQTVDVAIGPGPGRRLAGGILDPAAASQMETEGRLLYGQESYQVAMPGEKVLFYGGGATSAWGAMIATAPSGGARRAVWLARPGDVTAPVPDATQRVVDIYKAQGIHLTPQEIATFGGAVTEGNVSGFTSPKIERRFGEITSVRPGDPRIPGEAGKVVVSIDGRVETFDRLVLSIGQDISRPGGQVPLVGQLQFRMVMRGGRLVGLESVNPPGAVRLQGAAWATARPDKSGIADLVIPTERARFIELINAQANDASVPVESLNTPPSIHQTGKNVPQVSEPNLRTPATPDPRRRKD
ncbi:MAG TPA: hypothetical protein VFD41_02545, partial [Actinomycetales bacterium]|nr:hypothetical protein [Actinomycetales bacterium]